MTWTLRTHGGSLLAPTSVNIGTAANVTQLDTRYDYSVNYTFSAIMHRHYVNGIYEVYTRFSSPPAFLTDDPNAATNDPDYRHTFISERLQAHRG